MATNRLSTILAARFFLHPVLWLTRRARSFFVMVDKSTSWGDSRQLLGSLAKYDLSYWELRLWEKY